MELIHSVYFLLMIGLFGSLLYIVNVILVDSKKKLLYFLIFPPYMFYYILVDFSKTKDATIMAAVFLFLIAFVGFIGGQPFGEKAVHMLYIIFLWPIEVIKIII